MIKFRCSSCDKAIGVNEKYGGRLIKCPSCENATRVPAADGSTPPTPTPASAPMASPAMEATSDHLPTAIARPACPSCNTELFNPSDTICGVCGHLLDQSLAPSAPMAPIAPRPVQATPIMATPVSETPIVPGGVPASPTGLPVNPAIASPYAKPMSAAESRYDPPVANAADRSGPNTGRSVGAWLAAVSVGMFLALVWGIVASFTGAGGQIFGWAIGAIVGCIAGLIAKNRSIPFCLATTAGALLAMLFGRLVSTWVIMLAVSGMNSFQEFGEFFIPDSGVSIGVMEEMVKKGELEGEQKAVAEMKVEAFFSNKEIYEIDGYDDVSDEAELELDIKVRQFMKDMTDKDKQNMLESVRDAHPEWMEKEWYFYAILDSMVQNNEIEDAGLLAHAKSNLTSIDGDYDEQYYQNTTPAQMEEREDTLRKTVMEKFASMDNQQRLDAYKQARLNHLKWAPVEHEYLAMLDAMYATDDIPQELKETAKSEINLKLKMNYDDAFANAEDVDYEKREKLAGELRAVVNEQLLKLDQDEADKLVANARETYPDWEPDIGFEAFEELSGILDDSIAKFESDGTFWSSLKTRFKTMDFVWLILGTISAFTITFTLGQSEQKSEKHG